MAALLGMLAGAGLVVRLGTAQGGQPQDPKQPAGGFAAVSRN